MLFSVLAAMAAALSIQYGRQLSHQNGWTLLPNILPASTKYVPN